MFSFFIDTEPYILLFGAKKNNFGLKIKVTKNFCIDTNLKNSDYSDLCKVLCLEFNHLSKFSTNKFFEYFNNPTPNYISNQTSLKPQDFSYCISSIEDADKIYFMGWRDNYKWHAKVQSSNLEKTRKLLVEQFYKICLEKNISSCWTHDERLAVKINIL